MNVIMFCAGLNPELRPFTDYKPKCLLPISNKSILFHNLDWLERQNFKNGFNLLYNSSRIIK